ncbi:MAG: PAS domain S-box protein [Hyphomicrobiaceae bacterium]
MQDGLGLDRRGVVNAGTNSHWHGEIDDNAAGLEVVGASPDCVALISADGLIRAINRPGIELLQIDDPSAMVGRSWLAMWPPETHVQVKEAISHAASGKVARFSAPCPTAKGEDRWWDVSVTRVDRRNGNDHRILAISRDITRTKQLEEKLRISEYRFRAVADNIAQFAWMADPSGHIFWFNKRWYDYTGTSIEAMAGWGWKSVLHPDHVDAVVAKISMHFESGEPWEDTFPLRSAADEYRWFLSRAMPIRNDAGRITLWCGTNTDIHEQRNWSERLRQKARLIALSHEAIMTWSMRDGILAWNQGCQDLYGYSLEEATGRRSNELLRTRLPMPAAEFEQMLIREGAWSGELLHIDRNGQEVWVDSRQELLIVDDQKIVLELNRDITERRRNDELKRLLLAELDHRVKNTLAIVQAIAAQTARRARTPRDFTASFNARLQSLAQAHNLLVSSQWSGAWLRELIVDQVAIGDEIDRQISIEGENAFIPAQAALQLSLMFFELATNARKHGALSGRDGRLSVRWKRNPHDANRVDLTWQETGGPPATSPEAKGFGTTLIERTGKQSNLRAELTFAPAGLICRMSIETSGSHAGPTTYFDTRREENRRTARERRRLEVMIVEDEPLIALELEEIVAGNGFVAVGPLASVNATLASIARKPPDIVLLDGSLQGEPVDAIVAELHRLRIPFAMVTGFTEKSLPSGLDREVTPIISKPVEPEQIAHVVRELASRTR